MNDIAMKLIGHRGFPAQFPENTRLGVEAALSGDWRALGKCESPACKAAGIEVDIQFSKDGVPMLFHDAELERVTGLSGKLSAFESSVLERMSAHEASRFGEAFLGTPIEPLVSLVPVLQQYPEATLFVEVKDDSFDYIDRNDIVAALAIVLEPIAEQCVIIAYDLPLLRKVRDGLDWPVGWVLPDYADQSRHWASDFQPEYLFVNYKKLPDIGVLWQGLWEWVVYDITDIQLAERLCLRGAHWIETWDLSAFGDSHQD